MSATHGDPGPLVPGPATMVFNTGRGETMEQRRCSVCVVNLSSYSVVDRKEILISAIFPPIFDRTFEYDDYFWKSSCQQLCKRYDRRACNEQSCPINCLLSEFGSWSNCSPCAKKQASDINSTADINLPCLNSKLQERQL